MWPCIHQQQIHISIFIVMPCILTNTEGQMVERKKIEIRWFLKDGTFSNIKDNTGAV